MSMANADEIDVPVENELEEPPHDFILQKASNLLNFSNKWATCLSGVPRYIIGMFGPDGESAGDKAYVTFSTKLHQVFDDARVSRRSTWKNDRHHSLEFIDFLFPNESIVNHILIKGRGNGVVVRAFGCVKQKDEPGLRWSWTEMWSKQDKDIVQKEIDDRGFKLIHNSKDRCTVDITVSHPHLCNVIRLEIDTRLSDEHEIWAVHALGTVPPYVSSKTLIELQNFSYRCCPFCAQQSLRLRTLSLAQKYIGGSPLMQVTPGWFPVSQLSSPSESVKESEEEEVESESGSPSTLECLPLEILVQIVGHLDIRHHCRVARCSRTLHSAAWFSLARPVSRSLVLQPYWNTVNDTFLGRLSTDSLRVQHLDLSWCGSHNLISHEDGLKPLLLSCSPHLSTLRIVFCDAVTDNTLHIISQCSNLTELDISGCSGISGKGLKKLLPLASTMVRLSLVRTLTDNSAVDFFSQARSLRHLDVSECKRLSPDLMISALSKAGTALESLHIRFHPPVTVPALLNLPSSIRDLDLTRTFRGRDSLHALLPYWPALRSLRLGGARTISVRDVASVCEFCPRIEILDISSAQSSNWTPTLEQLLNVCHDLVFLDVSYIGIRLVDVDNFRRRFPKVTINQDRFRF